MRAVLDACVLVPPVVRCCLLGVAERGLIVPLWSARIFGEWLHAAARRGGDALAEAQAAAEAMRAAFPGSMIPPAPGVEARLHLPDANDIHVLATAIAGSADAIVTWNAADFPRGVLAGEGLVRRDPDGLVWELWSAAPGPVGEALDALRMRAEARAGVPVALPALLKRAGLTRLARALRG